MISSLLSTQFSLEKVKLKRFSGVKNIIKVKNCLFVHTKTFEATFFQKRWHILTGFKGIWGYSLIMNTTNLFDSYI